MGRNKSGWRWVLIYSWFPVAIVCVDVSQLPFVYVVRSRLRNVRMDAHVCSQARACVCLRGAVSHPPCPPPKFSPKQGITLKHHGLLNVDLETFNSFSEAHFLQKEEKSTQKSCLVFGRHCIMCLVVCMAHLIVLLWCTNTYSRSDTLT